MKSKFTSATTSITLHLYSKTAILVTWKRNNFIWPSWKPHHKSAASIWYSRPRCKEAKANWQISPLIIINIPLHAQICSARRANFHFMHNSPSRPRLPPLPSPPAWGSLWSKFGPSRSLHTLIFIWRLWTHWWRAVAAMLTFILWALSPRNPVSIWWTSLTGVSSKGARRLHLASPVPWVPPPVWDYRLWKILTGINIQ